MLWYLQRKSLGSIVFGLSVLMATGVVLFHSPSYTSPNWPWPNLRRSLSDDRGISHWSSEKKVVKELTYRCRSVPQIDTRIILYIRIRRFSFFTITGLSPPKSHPTQPYTIIMPYNQHFLIPYFAQPISLRGPCYRMCYRRVRPSAESRLWSRPCGGWRKGHRRLACSETPNSATFGMSLAERWRNHLETELGERMRGLETGKEQESSGSSMKVVWK